MGILSVLVTAPNLAQADRYSNVSCDCFQMGSDGVFFLDEINIFLSYMIKYSDFS